MAELLHPLESLFVPLFFVLMGIQVHVGSVGTWSALAFAAVLTVCAIAGKAACAFGVSRGTNRLAIAIGMIPRGEVGLIFAGIGGALLVDGRPLRRGIDITRGRGPNLMQLLTVGEAMQPVPEAIAQNRPLAEVVARFADEDVEALPIVDPAGQYRGTVVARQVEQSLRDNTTDLTAGDAAQETPTLMASQGSNRRSPPSSRAMRRAFPCSMRRVGASSAGSTTATC